MLLITFVGAPCRERDLPHGKGLNFESLKEDSYTFYKGIRCYQKIKRNLSIRRLKLNFEKDILISATSMSQ